MLRNKDYMEGSKFLLLSGFYFYSLFFLFIFFRFFRFDNKKTRINPRHLQLLSAMMGLKKTKPERPSLGPQF